ncbi:extracellular solute-binding protein [Paenibacillus alkalitolerans]|uniref:extracellular solute-binding protein n=1 Tax=Paenibacillus alkalitolerans TaxID=2799335 RepID=UPI0018F7716A|nr:extracellular solute-binding protein [Paenibacillus alkalitolerans]
MMRKMKRVILLVAVLILSLSGCAESALKPEKDTEQASSRTELTVWLWPGTGLEPLIKEYEKRHPELRIAIQSMIYEDVHFNLQTAFAAGIGAPDICLIEISYIERFKSFPDFFHNLADFGAGELNTRYLDWNWQQAQSKDGTFIFGLPTDIGPIAMVYRTELFREAGLPADRDEVAAKLSEWDDLIFAGERILKKTGKPMFDNIVTLYRAIIEQSEIQYFDSVTGEFIAESNPNVKRAWDYAVDASMRGLSAGIQTYTPEWGTGLNNGDFAVVLSPAWMTGFIKKNAPEAAGAWDISYMPGGGGNWGGSFLTIPKEGAHPEEAYRLIKWLTDPEQQLAVFEKNGNFPSSPAVYEHELIGKQSDSYFSEAPAGKIYAEAAKMVKPAGLNPNISMVQTAMEQALLKVERRQADPEQAWDDTMKQIMRDLNKYGAPSFD